MNQVTHYFSMIPIQVNPATSAFSWRSVSVEMRPSPCDLLFSSTCAIISQELLPDVTLRLLPPSNVDHGTNDRMVKNASDFLQKGHFSAHSSAIGKEPRGIFRKCPTHLCGYLQKSMKLIKFIWMIMFVVWEYSCEKTVHQAVRWLILRRRRLGLLNESEWQIVVVVALTGWAGITR